MCGTTSRPNMTRDNVIAHKLYTPDQMERKNLIREGDFSNGEFAPDQIGAYRPFPEASNYRTEIGGLYLCGPSAYPGGGVHAACGYRARFKAIAEDLGLPSPADNDTGLLKGGSRWADIYTPEWYEEVRDAMNAGVATMKAPPGGCCRSRWRSMAMVCRPTSPKVRSATSS